MQKNLNRAITNKQVAVFAEHSTFDVCSANVGGRGKCSYFIFNEESNI
jgi:hypothetical protein